MPLNITYNNATYTVPLPGENYGWGGGLTSYLQALSASMSPGIGLFPLTAELSFGSAFGLKAIYLKSNTSNPGTFGTVRLARTDVITWRNEANTDDLTLSVSADNQLRFNGVSIGNFQDYIDFNIAGATNQVARLKWNDQYGMLDVGLKGGSTTALLNEQYIRVYNQSGAQIPKGTVVRVFSTSLESTPSVAPANAVTMMAPTAFQIFGVTTESIDIASYGFMTQRGYIRNMNTVAISGATIASKLYLSGTTPGALSVTPASGSGTKLEVGLVIESSTTNGVIYVNIRQPSELRNTVSDVVLDNPLAGQSLQYDPVNQVFKNQPNFGTIFRQTVSSGGSVSFGNNSTIILAIPDPGPAITSYNVVMPVNPYIGREVKLVVSTPNNMGITGLSITSSVGHTIDNNVTSLNKGAAVSWVFNGSGVWVRLQ